MAEEETKKNSEEHVHHDKHDEEKAHEHKNEEVKTETKSEAKEEKKVEDKKNVKPTKKKTEAVVNAQSLPISTKQAGAICKFIRGKKIPPMIIYLEDVVAMRKAVPMKGEVPHKKGNIMSGKYPVKAAAIFIKLLKNLTANANVAGLNDIIISEAIANIASRPYGKFGTVRKKRTHVKLVARQKTKPLATSPASNQSREKVKKKKNGGKDKTGVKDSVK
jgi:large subunit ribosomal protein L22